MSNTPVLEAHGPCWLMSVNVLSSISALSVFFISSVIQSFQQRVDKAALKKRKSNSRPRLLLFQIASAGVIAALSIVHAVLIGKSGFVRGQTNSLLTSVLFLVLVWVIFLLGLSDRDQTAGAAYLRAWIVAGVLDLAAIVLLAFNSTQVRETAVAVDLAVQTIRVVAIFGLIAGTIFVGRREPATAEEIQPLLGATNDPATSADTKKSDSLSSDDASVSDSDDEDDEGIDKDEQDDIVDKAALNELKRRPLRQYIASFGIFLPHLRPRNHLQWLYIATMGACTLIQRVLNVFLPLTLGALVNSLTNAHSVPWTQAGAYLALTVIQTAGILSTVSDLASARFQAAAKTSLDTFAYNHIMNLSCNFHEAENSQRLGRLIDRGDVVAELFNMVLFRVLPQISDLFISLAVLAYLFGGYVCFIVATTIVLFAWANTKFIKRKSKLRRRWWNSMEAQWQHLFESNYNWMTVSHFNRIPHEQEEFGKRTTEMYARGITSSNFDAVAQFVRQGIVSSGFIAACVMAVQQIVYSNQGVGSFVMLVTYWNSVMSPVSGLIYLINRTSENLVDAERLLVILEQKPKVQDADDAKDIDFQGGAVDFENVTFSYDGARIVSENISFHIDAGQTVAIVGETGGGKSTLLKLLFRFYDPTEGRIFIDGQDVRDLKIESFRDLIGFVPQDPAMFERSVADNVRYPDLTATEEDVQEACKGAVLHDKIMTFTKGYKQKVGKKGARLSGGEQQRLAIARCIIKKPKMLLLDEATSSVDSVTETKIHEGLKKLCSGRTTFIIAHRLSTILHADQILVMKNGKLVEAGPHRKLIKQNGAYRELWDAQLKLQEADPDAGELRDTEKTGDIIISDVESKNGMTEDTLVSVEGSETEVDMGGSSSRTTSKSPVRHGGKQKSDEGDGQSEIKGTNDEDDKDNATKKSA